MNYDNPSACDIKALRDREGLSLKEAVKWFEDMALHKQLADTQTMGDLRILLYDVFVRVGIEDH